MLFNTNKILSLSGGRNGYLISPEEYGQGDGMSYNDHAIFLYIAKWNNFSDIVKTLICLS